MRVGVLLALLCAIFVNAAPSSAAIRDHLHLGLEAGSTIPVDPSQYSANWDPSRGFGVVVLYDMTPNVSGFLRYDYDLHEFNGRLYSTWGVDQVMGSDASFHGIWAGAQRQQVEGLLRAHVAIYVGLAYREGRRATLVDSVRTETHGETDQWVGGYGIGVGLTLHLDHLPDIYAEARMLWLEPEQQVPLRIGVRLP